MASQHFGIGRGRLYETCIHHVQDLYLPYQQSSTWTSTDVLYSPAGVVDLLLMPIYRHHARFFMASLACIYDATTTPFVVYPQTDVVGWL